MPSASVTGSQPDLAAFENYPAGRLLPAGTGDNHRSGGWVQPLRPVGPGSPDLIDRQPQRPPQNLVHGLQDRRPCIQAKNYGSNRSSRSETAHLCLGVRHHCSACIVNSIEFACSAALPAIFTHTLSLRDLPLLEYYGYRLLCVFFFMLDDLIIFSLAVLALDTNLGQRDAAHCRVFSGLVLIALGGVMVFSPE